MYVHCIICCVHTCVQIMYTNVHKLALMLINAVLHPLANIMQSSCQCLTTRSASAKALPSREAKPTALASVRGASEAGTVKGCSSSTGSTRHATIIVPLSHATCHCHNMCCTQALYIHAHSYACYMHIYALHAMLTSVLRFHMSMPCTQVQELQAHADQ